MALSAKTKQFLLCMGDALIFYAALIAMLMIRYGAPLAAEFFNIHIIPFTAILPLWIIIFYIGGLYEPRALKTNVAFLNRYAASVGAAALFAALLFYFVPFFGITPRINLFIFLGLVVMLGALWRTLFNRLLAAGAPPARLLILDENDVVRALIPHLADNPQLGYEVRAHLKGGLDDPLFPPLGELITRENITTIAIPAHLKKQSRAARAIYKQLVLGIEVTDLADLYESIFKKVPLDELEEVWFLENIAKRHRIYETLKRPIELALAILFLPLLVPLTLLTGIYLLLIAGLPLIYTQTRVGQHARVFTLYKFRTMRPDAETQGPRWADEQDARTIPGAALIRAMHLDELPQIWNILRGDLSIVGPRPERPEFTEGLRKEIPYYNLRHLIRPGVTGWAQVNYRYGRTAEDAYEKLQFDIYYLKHRSLTLDVLIVLRTARLLVANIR